ncbi:MAG: hypothetical protein R3B48_02520 [Kofleriaceae bacterium]
MKHLGWAIFAILTTTVACKRADPKETQMSGEKAAVLAEPPIAAPGERIPAPGETVAAPQAKAPDTSFAVALQVPAEVAAGAEAVAAVKVTPGEGYKVNEEYPTKLTLETPAGVTTAKAVLLKADAAAFDKHRLQFDVKLTAATAGTYTVHGTLAFAVCTDATCDPKSEKIAINLVAK